MASQTEIYIVIDDGNNRYYLLKVVRRGLDVYCFPPELGIHVSVHASGEIHFTNEDGPGKKEGLPIALMMGQAGRMMGRGIFGVPLIVDGPAVGICTAIYPVTDLSEDFTVFDRNRPNIFVIDASAFPPDTAFVTVGVWGVPDRNQTMFTWNYPDIPDESIYKSSGEPPIWVYAQPC